MLNEKAKSYIVTFFNGDVKLYRDGIDQEVLNVKELHNADAGIKDSLFLMNDLLNKKLLVTCSTAPQGELKISEVVKTEQKDYGFTQLATSKAEEIPSEGISSLSANPLNNEFFCSASS